MNLKGWTTADPLNTNFSLGYAYMQGTSARGKEINHNILEWLVIYQVSSCSLTCFEEKGCNWEDLEVPMSATRLDSFRDAKTWTTNWQCKDQLSAKSCVMESAQKSKACLFRPGPWGVLQHAPAQTPVPLIPGSVLCELTEKSLSHLHFFQEIKC